MDSDSQSGLLKCHDALAQKGFKREATYSSKNLYKGVLDPTARKIPVSIEFDDLEFLEFPAVRIDADYPINGRMLPHLLGPSREVCYYAKGSTVLDRYNPAGTLIQCLGRAEQVVLDALKGKLDADFAAEFRAYWGSTWMLVDLPANFTGRAHIHYVDVRGDGEKKPVLCDQNSWALRRDTSYQPNLETAEPAVVAETKTPLSLDPNKPWPFKTLEEFNAWLEFTAPDLLGVLEGAMSKGSRSVCSLVINAPNGIYASRIEVPAAFRKEEFLTNRRSNLPKLIKKFATAIPVERISGVRADAEFIYSRNMGTRKNLKGKNILLIGCGTIGSFLAQMLANVGAGAGKGKLTLVDNDQLQPSNLGRHLLGVSFLHKNKAEGCSSLLQAQLPSLSIESFACSVAKIPQPKSPYDLIIDATGEEALSLHLNHLEVSQRPRSSPHVFVWLMGNGAIAQCILTGSDKNACLKCLKPDLSGEHRFRSLRPGATIEFGQTMDCGDAEFIPFPVSRSVAAAAMACDLVLDWTSGKPGDHFRSLTFDEHVAFKVSNCSPSPLSSCPACGKA